MYMRGPSAIGSTIRIIQRDEATEVRHVSIEAWQLDNQLIQFKLFKFIGIHGNGSLIDRTS
jgi:hypothetical protein